MRDEKRKVQNMHKSNMSKIDNLNTNLDNLMTTLKKVKKEFIELNEAFKEKPPLHK